MKSVKEIEKLERWLVQWDYGEDDTFYSEADFIKAVKYNRAAMDELGELDSYEKGLINKSCKTIDEAMDIYFELTSDMFVKKPTLMDFTGKTKESFSQLNHEDIERLAGSLSSKDKHISKKIMKSVAKNYLKEDGCVYISLDKNRFIVSEEDSEKVTLFKENKGKWTRKKIK